MASTYEKIATTTLGSDTNSINFTSISGSYTDLILIGSLQVTAGGTNPGVYFNSSTGSVSQTSLYGTGSAAGSFRLTGYNFIFFGGGSDTANVESNVIVHIQNYANTTTNKTCLIRWNHQPSEVYAVVGMRNNTAAITAVNLTTQAGNYKAGSTFTLYGILKA